MKNKIKRIRKTHTLVIYSICKKLNKWRKKKPNMKQLIKTDVTLY